MEFSRFPSGCLEPDSRHPSEIWRSRRELNPHQKFRKLLFYPLNYGNFGSVLEPGNWSRLSGSNRRHPDYKSGALPTELSRLFEIDGAGEGSRTLVCNLEGCRSTVELHPRVKFGAGRSLSGAAARRPLRPAFVNCGAGWTRTCPYGDHCAVVSFFALPPWTPSLEAALVCCYAKGDIVPVFQGIVLGRYPRFLRTIVSGWGLPRDSSRPITGSSRQTQGLLLPGDSLVLCAPPLIIGWLLLSLPARAPIYREKFWSGRRESNPRHSPWEGDALPAELLPRLKDVVEVRGFEPLAFSMPLRRSTN